MNVSSLSSFTINANVNTLKCMLEAKHVKRERKEVNARYIITIKPFYDLHT